MHLSAPKTPAEFDAVRGLCWEYRDYLLTFPSPEVDYVRKDYSDDAYAALMSEMETVHVPPIGGCILAMENGSPVGCGMFHTFEPGTAEVKRVYVRESARGSGLGRAITQALIDQCRALGFSRILMDTGRIQAAAHALYVSMGFTERGPYQDIPDEMVSRMHFFEMAL
jgi:GNAT superfamily N-acetyltransferase